MCVRILGHIVYVYISWRSAQLTSSHIYLTFITHSANSADNKFVFLFFLENRFWRFVQIVSIGDNLHEMSNLFSRENKKTFQHVVCWKFLPRVLSVKCFSLQRRLMKVDLKCDASGGKGVRRIYEHENQDQPARMLILTFAVLNTFCSIRCLKNKTLFTRFILQASAPWEKGLRTFADREGPDRTTGPSLSAYRYIGNCNIGV